MKIRRLSVVLALLLAGAVAPAAEPALLGSCPGGRMYRHGDQRVLLLSGEPYAIGYAHGKLLAEDIRTVTARVLLVCRVADKAKGKGFFAGTIDKAWDRLQPHIPPRYLEELRGLADGSGVPLRDIQRANVFPALFHCSGFALFGKATQGGDLLHGRVLDYMTKVGLQRHAVTMIVRPAGRHAFVNVSYAGFIGSVTGMNERQVAIGEMGGRGEGLWDGEPMPLLMRRLLEEADTLDEAVEGFRQARRTCEYYYVVSDGKGPDARGLYCTPDRCEVLRPGQRWAPKLPDAVDDAVVFSGSSRLRTLLARIRSQYGRIGPAEAIRLMDRPVSMKSNLHNALFAPQSLRLWVAHARLPTVKHYQACYQTYQPYDLKRWLKRLPKSTGQAADRPAPAVAAESDDVAARIGRLAPQGGTFGWSMKLLRVDGNAQAVWEVRLPSPRPSGVKENDTVLGEYYPATTRPGPGVVVLHVAGGNLEASRVVCRSLAGAGVNALRILLPYSGQRRPRQRDRDPKRRRDLEGMIEAFRQGVGDVRRAAAWLADRPEVDAERIGLCGLSLGGFTAALTGGVDGRFDRVAVVVAGGRLDQVIRSNQREVRNILSEIRRRQLSVEQVRALLADIEPMTYAHRLRDAKVLMLNGARDKLVPPECAWALGRAAGAEIVWYPASHYSAALFLPDALGRLKQFFNAPPEASSATKTTPAQDASWSSANPRRDPADAARKNPTWQSPAVRSCAHGLRRRTQPDDQQVPDDVADGGDGVAPPEEQHAPPSPGGGKENGPAPG